MSKELLFYCNVPILYGNDPIFEQVPGIETYKEFAKYFDVNVSLYDRSNTIKFPFNMKATSLPKFSTDFNLSYKDCALQRIKELDDLHLQTGKKFRLMYSGGVDSTGIFAAFIAHYGISKTRDLLEICCSKESIDENPWVWDRYIRKFNFNIVNAHDYSYNWDDGYITVMGEGNDQLFGKRSDYSYYVENKTNDNGVTLDDLTRYYRRQSTNPEKLAEIAFKLLQTAPFLIPNMFTFLWWINFVMTWDGISNRVMSQAIQNSLPSDTTYSGLVQFYNTPEFQKWGMSYHYNYDHSVAPIFKKDCKAMILSILDIPEYKDKHKTLSFPKLHSLRPTAYLIDADLKLYRNTTDYLKFIQPNNSFM